MSAAVKQALTYAEGYVQGYEMEADQGTYHPTSADRAMMLDLVNGLLSDETFIHLITRGNWEQFGRAQDRKLHAVIHLPGVKEELQQLLWSKEPAPPIHPDDLAVDRFAEAMKIKLAQKRAEGRWGWESAGDYMNAHLSKLLIEHVHKGDPLDVGNLAMMIHQRHETIAP